MGPLWVREGLEPVGQILSGDPSGVRHTGFAGHGVRAHSSPLGAGVRAILATPRATP